MELPAFSGNPHLDLDAILKGTAAADLRRMIESHGLVISALSNHTGSQIVLDPYGKDTDEIFPGSKEENIRFGTARMVKTAQAANALGVPVVCGFVGCENFGRFFPFPYAQGWPEMEREFVERWGGILDRFAEYGVKFAHKPHPNQLIYDTDTALRSVELMGGRKEWEGIPGGMGTAGPDTPVIDLTEIVDLARGASYTVESAGNPALTLALTQPDKDIPDYAYLHFWLQNTLRQALRPETVVIGSAYSIFRDGRNKFRGVRSEEFSLLYCGNKNIRDGFCDMIALGRQSLADPLLPAKLAAGRQEEIHWCTTCDNCIEFLIRQQPVGCAAHDSVYARALQEIRRREGRLAEKHT